MRRLRIKDVFLRRDHVDQMNADDEEHVYEMRAVYDAQRSASRAGGKWHSGYRDTEQDFKKLSFGLL